MRVRDLSRLTGINQHGLAKLYYENAREIPVDTLDKVCKVLECRIDELIEYIPDEPVSPREAGSPGLTNPK